MVPSLFEEMEWWWIIVWIISTCMNANTKDTSSGLVEVTADGRLLHYTPMSSSSSSSSSKATTTTTHWVFPFFSSLSPSPSYSYSYSSSGLEPEELLVGPETFVFEIGPNDSLIVSLDPARSASIETLDIAALVRCHLGCDARLEAMAWDGLCEVTSPPACIRLIPRFRRLVFCLETGEFVKDPSELPFVNVHEALAAQRLLYGNVPYNVTIAC